MSIAPLPESYLVFAVRSESPRVHVHALLLLLGPHRAIDLSGELPDTNFSSGRDATTRSHHRGALRGFGLASIRPRAGNANNSLQAFVLPFCRNSATAVLVLA